MNVEIYKCPNCGGNIDLSNESCIYCGVQYKVTKYRQLDKIDNNLISKIATMYNNKSDIIGADLTAGICYLKLKQYQFALLKLNKAIEKNPFDSESYFYKAITILKGKKPFLLTRVEIEEVESCIQSGIAISSDCRLYYLWAIVRYDYYYRKAFNVSPNYIDILNLAIDNDLTIDDKEEVFGILGFRWDNL